MNRIVRNTLAAVAGIFAGGVVNMAIVTIGPSIIPPPPGVDVTDSEALAEAIHLFEARHFVAPFLAHALGTLAGSLVAFVLAAGGKAVVAWVVGAFFLAGGIGASFMIPAPAWFIALDLCVAYLPMAYLGARLGARVKLTQD